MYEVFQADANVRLATLSSDRNTAESRGASVLILTKDLHIDTTPANAQFHCYVFRS